MEDEDLLERIVLNPKVMAGKPVICGTRLPVEYRLNLLAHVFRDGRLHKGIILLRLEDEGSISKIQVLSLLLESYTDHLPYAFLVVTENQVRLAKS